MDWLATSETKGNSGPSRTAKPRETGQMSDVARMFREHEIINDFFRKHIRRNPPATFVPFRKYFV